MNIKREMKTKVKIQTRPEVNTMTKICKISFSLLKFEFLNSVKTI